MTGRTATMDMTVTMEVPGWTAVIIALEADIAGLRQSVACSVDPKTACYYEAGLAASMARHLRQAELAYHRCGGRIPRYLPAVYRPPTVHTEVGS